MATGTTPATTRQLVVFEKDTVANVGRMFAIDPAAASGIGLPAFRAVPTLPATGNVVGQAVLLPSGLSYVWNGLNWVPIVPPAIVTYPTDASVFADTAPAVGTVAFSTSSGNLFRRYGAPAKWRQLGIRSYGLQADLLSDAAPDASIGFAVDTGEFWARAAGAWRPMGLLSGTEAAIQAAPAAPWANSFAFSTDTNRLLFSDGTNWFPFPIRDWPTEAALLAATPPDNTFAAAQDTGRVFYRTGGNWLPSNGRSIPSGTTDPTTAAAGDLFWNTTSSEARIYEGGAWRPLAPASVNDLTDADTATTAPKAKDVLTWDGSKWVPGKGASVVVGAEPAASDRFPGLLWYDGARLWIWDTAATTWVET